MTRQIGRDHGVAFREQRPEVAPGMRRGAGPMHEQERRPGAGLLDMPADAARRDEPAELMIGPAMPFALPKFASIGNHSSDGKQEPTRQTPAHRHASQDPGRVIAHDSY